MGRSRQLSRDGGERSRGRARGYQGDPVLIFRVFLLVLCVFVGSCGYHVSGHSDLIPQKIHTIAIPVWGNITNRYRLSEWLPNAMAREFIARTRYRIVPNVNEADAILSGAVMNVLAFPSVTDPVSGRATAIQISVFLQVSLTDRATGKVLFNRPNMEFRQRYEIAVDQRAYFDESDIAMQRLTSDVARTLVSSILEAF